MLAISVRNNMKGRFAFLLIQIMILFAILTPFVPSAAAPTPAPNPEPKQLRVMTYNIRHAKGLDGKVRPQAIVQELRAGGADLIALQEVDRYQWRSGFQDQARYFARELGMHYAYAPAMSSGLSQYGVALLSRYPLDSPKHYALTGGREPRCLLTAELRVGGRTITAATTHLGVSASERGRQLPQLLGVLKQVKTPFVLMGDFNSSSANLQQLELTRLKLPQSTSTVLNGGEIDHIFVSPELASERGAAVIPSRASDHVPVIGSLALKFPDKL